MTPELQPREKFRPNPKVKLREQLAEVMRFKHFSHRTETAYWHWIKGFIQFHRSKDRTAPQPSPLLSGAEREKGWRHPRELGAAEVQSYLSHLARERNVAAATQAQALCWLRVQG